MKKLKSFSEIKTFNNYEISKQIKPNIFGGLGQPTENFHTYREQTCEYSCVDYNSVTTKDGAVFSTVAIDTNFDCE